MKQGRASRDVSESHPVTRPTVHRVSEAYTTQLGTAAYYKKDKMYQGRGFEAPKPHSVATHKSGQQGRH
jgi:hypothetical protein